MDSIADLENAMQEENLLCMKIHKVFDLVIQVQENIEEKKEEIVQVCKKNNVTLQEINEISDGPNYDVRMIIEGEEILGPNQRVQMNMHNSVKSKKIKKREKSKKNYQRKRQKIAIIRK
jgi:hypothetical protein